MKTSNTALTGRILFASVFAFVLGSAPADAGDSGWFITGDIGPSFVNNQSVTSMNLFGGPATTTRLSFKTGVRLDAGGGYQFGGVLALDAELGYIYNSVDFANSGVTSARDLYQVPLMFNAIFTLPVDWRIKPYVGAGLGAVVTGLDDLHDVNGAGQLQAGLKCEINRWIDVGLEYRLLATTTHDWNDFLGTTQGGRTINNSIVANLTIKF